MTGSTRIPRKQPPLPTEPQSLGSKIFYLMQNLAKLKTSPTNK